MTSPKRQSIVVAGRVLIACASLFGAWLSFGLARADYLFQQETYASVRAATQLESDAPDYYVRLAQLDEDLAPELLQTALKLNPYNAAAAIALGLRYEAQGNFLAAEKLLVQATEVDRTYLPRWSLANFYLRRQNLPAFWLWARRAAEMPADDVGALFELCWRVSPDPISMDSIVSNAQPQVLRQYLSFLLKKNQWGAAGEMAERLIAAGSAEQDRSLMLSVVNQLISVDEPTTAIGVWDHLIDQHWITAERAFPNNGAFAREPLPVRFDWTIQSYAGLNSWPGPAGLKTEFTGDEPENCEIAEQTLVLPRGNYALQYSYRTTGIPEGTGIRWQLFDPKSQKVIAESNDLSSDNPAQQTLSFSLPSDKSITIFRLVYQRPLGTTRISGELLITSVRIKLNQTI